MNGGQIFLVIAGVIGCIILVSSLVSFGNSDTELLNNTHIEIKNISVTPFSVSKTTGTDVSSYYNEERANVSFNINVNKTLENDQYNVVLNMYNGDKLVKYTTVSKYMGSDLNEGDNDFRQQLSTSSSANYTFDKVEVVVNLIGDKHNRSFYSSPLMTGSIDINYNSYANPNYVAPKSETPKSDSSSSSSSDLITVKTTTSDYFTSFDDEIFHLWVGDYGCDITRSQFHDWENNYNYISTSEIVNLDLVKWYFKAGLTIKLKENSDGYEFVSITT